MRDIEQIKNDEIKMCYDLVLERQAYDTLKKLIAARIEELEYMLVNMSETEKSYEEYKSVASERIIVRSFFDMIQQGAELYNNQLKGAKQ